MVMKDLIKDFVSDFAGAIGYTTISVMPVVEAVNDIVKLFGSIIGLFLLYLSVRYKLELLREKRRQNEKNSEEDKPKLSIDNDSGNNRNRKRRDKF